jgi:hypothetical protein
VGTTCMSISPQRDHHAVSRSSKQLPRLKTPSSIAKLRDALTRTFVTAAMFASAKCAAAILAPAGRQ